MRILAALLIVLPVCSAGWAAFCPPIYLYSDNELSFAVYWDNAPARATTLQLYAGGKLIKSAATDQNGRVNFGRMPPGRYRIYMGQKGTLDIIVRSQWSNLNEPLIIWSLFSNTKDDPITRGKLPGNGCPLVGLKDD